MNHNHIHALRNLLVDQMIEVTNGVQDHLLEVSLDDIGHTCELCQRADAALREASSKLEYLDGLSTSNIREKKTAA